MLATDIARKLLETDQDFDPLGEINRYFTSKYPDITIESEFNHWNVYHLDPAGRMKIGTVYYDDMSEVPETMTPEQRTAWEAKRWTAVPTVMGDPTSHTTFDNAVEALVPPGMRKRARNEALDPDDPNLNIEKLAKEKATEPELFITNDNGRKFRVKIVWDEPAGGTSYDAKGNVVPDTPYPTVKFYDMTYADDPKYPTFKGKGQFVSSYYAATLMERPGGGLALYGGVPEWEIDYVAMDSVRKWIKSEVEDKRGYRLKDVLFGMQYEAIDPDDPELYAHPERYTQQPSDEKIEGALRRILAPYYPQVRISKRPGIFAGQDTLHLGKRTQFKDNFVWTIHCNRDTPLPLPTGYGNVVKYGYYIDWRAEVEKWFDNWATECGLHIFKFEIYGRLRKDPTFQLETVRLGPLKESDDLTPEAFLANYVDKLEVDRELVEALWKFHPYGVGYNAVTGPRGGFISVQTYFPPEKDRFIERFRDFALNWLKERKAMTVTMHKLTTWAIADSPYPRWCIMLSLNSNWPPNQPEYVAPPSAPA